MVTLFSTCWKAIEHYFLRQPSALTAKTIDNYLHLNLIHDQPDALLWHKDLNLYKPAYKQHTASNHMAGDLSVAVVQANASLEDQCQVKVGPYATLIGIYDGHGGPDASRFISHRLFPKIEFFARESGGVSSKVLMKAFNAMEEEFLAFVHRLWRVKPKMVSVGSCCLVGAICGNRLYVANVGDSRVVLGTLCPKKNEVIAVRLSEEHNASNAEVREELKAQHPHDSHIVTLKHGVWRVKGIIQVSRSIGDVYLKSPEFNTVDPLLSNAGVRPLTFDKPVLSAEPSLYEKELSPGDRFLIFASDGLWDMMSDQEAVDIVQKGPRKGIARKIVRCALKQAARKYALKYSELKKIKPGARRNFHDDISVVVVYLSGHNNNMMQHIYATSKYRSLSCHAQERVSCHVNAPLDISSSDILESLASM